MSYIMQEPYNNSAAAELLQSTGVPLWPHYCAADEQEPGQT